MTTYTVTVVDAGSGNKYNIDGVAQATVYLDTSGSFTFDQSASSNDGHPLQLSTTSDGTHNSGTRYDTGVVYKGDGATVSATDYVNNFDTYTTRSVTITTSASTPNLFYYCFYHSGMGGSVSVSDANSWSRHAWGHGFWGNQASAGLTTTSVSATTALGTPSVDATIGTGWGRDAWSSLAWGVSFTVELDSLTMSFAQGAEEALGDALVSVTGLSVTSAVGTATGEPEHVIFPTGVSSTTTLGSVSILEGHGVLLGSLEMTTSLGTETATGSVDAGWGRGNWGSFAWNENIEFITNVSGVSMSFAEGALAITSGIGVNVNVTGLQSTFATGTPIMTGFSALVTPTPVTMSMALSGATVSGEGSVGVVAPSDQLDFNLGTPVVDIFTQVDATSVQSTFTTGSVSITGDAPSVDLTGTAMTSALGSPTIGVGSGVIVSVSTVALSFAQGEESITGGAVVQPTGVSLSVVQGNVFSTPWANVVTGASNTWTEVDAA